MREILFRGKRESDGKWICGMYDNEKHSADFDCIIPRRDSEDHGSADWAVIPETVGQYTGLTDKNGVKIFEGDVVLAKDTDYKAVVEWQPDTCRFLAIITNRRDERSPHFFYVDKGSDRGSQMSSNEIIGNIHDNPELR